MAVLKATKRDELGTRKVRRLRTQGLIPGIIYGHAQEAQSVSLNEHEVELAILHGERLLEIELDGKTQNVLIKEVQYDTFGKEVLHIDLARVDLDERVEVTVAIVLKGTPVGVTEEDGMLQQMASEVRVECTVRSIPEHIDVMVADMKVGDSLTMGQLALPDGAKLVSDPEMRVAAVRVVVEAEAEPTEEEEQAAPDVIGEKEQPEEEGQGD